jgi:hypothetical protein
LLILGNFFCDSAGVDWRENLVSIEDGGDCYFQVEYDVDRGFFILLLVNGEA